MNVTVGRALLLLPFALVGCAADADRPAAASFESGEVPQPVESAEPQTARCTPGAVVECKIFWKSRSALGDVTNCTLATRTCNEEGDRWSDCGADLE